MTGEDLFIGPGQNVDASHPGHQHFAGMTKDQVRSRWDTSYGQERLRAWGESGYDRDLLEECFGKFFGQIDLRGVPLAGKSLSKLNLSFCDLFAADLAGADLSGATLQQAYLSEADIRGTRFDWARMPQAMLDNADFDDQTSFLGVPLNEVNFNLAVLIQERAQTQQRIANLEHYHPRLAKFLKHSCDYGRSLRRWLLWVAGVIVLFGLLFSVCDLLRGADGFWDGLYFSVVTFATLGYGDIVPITPIAKLLVILEVSIGYAMGGLLVAILSRKILGA